jgi:hypothetical protein
VRFVIWETNSVIKTQRRYRTPYGKDPPLDNAIQHWLKQFQETGNVTSLDELKLKIVAAIGTVSPQMLEKSWREIEYRLDILRATKVAHVEVV